MTDNEITKALECCSSNATGDEHCKDCPYNFTEYCGEESAKDILDLIKRKDAEIEKRQAEYKTLRQIAIHWMNKCNELQAEIEKWKEEANKYQNLWCEAVADLQNAKSEAIKEFAEWLKGEKWFDSNYGEWLISESDIDNLVKEMTGTND